MAPKIPRLKFVDIEMRDKSIEQMQQVCNIVLCTFVQGLILLILKNVWVAIIAFTDKTELHCVAAVMALKCKME